MAVPFSFFRDPKRGCILEPRDYGMPGDSSIKVEDPRVVAAVEKYRNLLQTSGDPELLCDVALDASLPDDQRNRMVRALLYEERKFRRKQGLSTAFETYFSRVWFEKCIDELVAVMLDKDYLVEGRLGHGGQGRVYRVRNRAVHNRKEALKIFLPTDPQYLKEFDNKQYLAMQARFDRESEALSRIHINHLPAVHAVGNRDGLRYFTMEYIDGASLAKRIEQERLVDPRQAAQWMLTVAETLEELHAAKILHRDLKPSNLILNEKDKLYIVDFGLVKLMPGANADTTSFGKDKVANLTLSHGYGSRGYVSPEQAMNASQVTPATDIYALGATLYHMLNGFPYLGDNKDGPQHWLPHVPEPLQRICRDCLKLNPEERPRAEQVADELRMWLQKEQKSTRTSPSVVEIPPSPPRRRFLYFAAGGIAVAGAAGLFLFTRERHYGMHEISNRAHELREKLTQLLLSARLSDGAGYHTGFSENSPSTREAYPVARNVAALLSSFELPAENVSLMARDLQIPFADDAVETRVQTDRQLRPVGWVSASAPSRTFFDTVAWVSIAQAKLLNRLNRDENSEPRLIKTIQSQYERTQEMYAPYFDSRSGGWFPFPNAGSSESKSTWSTALALQMLAEAKKAGLSLGRNAPSSRDDLVNKALKYLGTGGWETTDSTASESDRARALRVFASIWSAYAETEILPSPTQLSQWSAAATELVLSYRDRQPAALATPLTHRAEAKTLAGDTKTFEETTLVYWYPLVVSLLQSLNYRALKQFAEEKEARPLRQLLGLLVVEKGDEMIERIKKSGEVAAAAEMLLGLANVRAGE